MAFVRRRCAVCLTSALLLSGASAVFAADAPPFAVLLNQALTDSPLLQERQADVGAASADVAQAKVWANPRLDALVENVGAPQSGGQSQRQSTYSVTQPLEVLGQRAARVQVFEQQLRATEAKRQQTRVAFAAELAVAHASAEAALARKALAQEDLQRANEDLRAARAQVQAGKEADIRVAQARASVAAAQAFTQVTEAEVTRTLSQLAALAGVSTPYTGVSTSLLGAQLPRGTPQGEAPAVLAALAERDVQEAQVVLEQKRWLPEIGVSAGVRSYGWSGQRGYVVGVSASIPFMDQNTNGIAAAKQRIVAADARLTAARLQADAVRRVAEAQVTAAEQQLLAATEGERAAAEAYRLGRIGYESGKTSLMELLVIRRALSDAKGSTTDAQLARVRALSALAQADGKLAFGE